jgi:hypothetical protein
MTSADEAPLESRDGTDHRHGRRWRRRGRSHRSYRTAAILQAVDHGLIESLSFAPDDRVFVVVLISLLFEGLATTTPFSLLLGNA